MQSLGHAVRLAEALNKGFHEEQARVGRKPVTPEQKAESAKIFKQTNGILQKTLSGIESALSTVRQAKKEKAAAAAAAERAIPVPIPVGPVKPPAVPVAPVVPVIPGPPSQVENILKTFGHGGKQSAFSTVTDTVEGMVSSIEPVLDTFDQLLVKPYLHKHQATLDTVPIMGLKNGQIMYLATVRDGATDSGIKLQWRQFSTLPSDLALPEPVANGSRTYYPGVHIFPYDGHLFVSSGRAVWRRQHRNPEDEAITNGVNDYSSMYQPVWEKIGDAVLPDANLRNIVPFFEVTGAGQKLNPKLVVLHENRTISVVNDSILTSTASWSPMTYANNVPGINKQWEHIAYWNSKIVATTIDDGKTYSQNLHLSLGTRKYFVSNKAEIDPLVEMTATEVGPVAIQADGTMRLRRVDEDKLEGDEEIDESVPTTPEGLFDQEPVTWDVFGSADGVTNFGIGSAGVQLDLGILARVLRLRYVDSQAALYPVMLRFRAFAQTHKAHLQAIKQLAESLPPSGPSEGDVTLATRVISHAKQWSGLLASNINASNETVVLMARQLDGIQEDIELQLSSLRDELKRLESVLQINQDQLTTYRRAFISTLVLGILFIAASAATAIFGPIRAALPLGLLGAGFIAAAITTGIKMAELRGEIETNTQDIAHVEEAIDELTFISARFGNLESMYGSLKVFWGGLRNDANSINDIHLPLMAMDIAEMLKSPESYEVALENTDNILTSSQLYLDMLNRQGIILPTGPFRRGGLRTVEEEIEAARVCLENGDLDGYEAQMRIAVTQDRETREEQAKAVALVGGVMFDVSMLRATAGLFNSSASFPEGASDVGTARGIRDEVTKAGRAVDGLLDKVVEMCSASQEALQDWRGAGGGCGVHLEGAISACRAAQTHAAEANNCFVRVNHLATDYQHRLTQDVARREGAISTARAVAEEQSRAVVASAPKYLFLFPAALATWIAKRRAQIAKNLQGQISALRSDVTRLRSEMQSGSTLLDNELTWKAMVQQVSQHLGDIYVLLDTVHTFMAEVPDMLEQTGLAEVNWAAISQDAKEVRAILASQGVPLSSGPLVVGRRAPGDSALADNRKQQLLAALKPDPTLAGSLTTQAGQATKFFDAADTLVTTPLLAGLFASYGEEDDDEDDDSGVDDEDLGPIRPSIRDVAVELRLRFTDAGAQQLNTLSLLEAMGALQKLRVQYLASGSQSLSQVIRNTVRLNDSAVVAAGSAYDYYLDRVRTWFADIITTLDTTLDDLVNEIAQLDENIEDLQEQQRKNVISLVAKLVALAFTLSGAIVSLSALSPRVAAEIAARKFAKASFKVAKKSTKAALESVDIKEVRESIIQLKNARAELRIQAQTIERVLPDITGVEIQLGGFKGVLGDMGERLDYIAGNIHDFQWLQLTQADVDEVGAAWDEVMVGANQVGDVFYRAGII